VFTRFYSLEDENEIIQKWREDDNNWRPDSSLGNRSPKEYIESITNLERAPQRSKSLSLSRRRHPEKCNRGDHKSLEEQSSNGPKFYVGPGGRQN